MHTLELVLALLVAVVALATVAPLVRVPTPILLVLGGLLLALLPQVPDIVLAPDLAFLLFLPPLLYSAAFSTRDVRAHLQPILSLAIGLVLATTAAVAVLVHTLLPELGWPLAFAPGAIVSPPDAVAAVAVFRGLGVPRRLVTVLEGESLFNDATALVAYQTALAAAATATFSLGDASLRFLGVGIGGLLVGLVVGWLVAHLQRHLVDPAVEIAVSLLTPTGAYGPSMRSRQPRPEPTIAALQTVGRRIRDGRPTAAPCRPAGLCSRSARSRATIRPRGGGPATPRAVPGLPVLTPAGPCLSS